MSKSSVTAKPSRNGNKLAQRGMTLAEVIYCVLILALVALGVLGVITTSLKISALSRLNDSARAVLRTYADQFDAIAPASIAQAATLISNGTFMDIGSRPNGVADYTMNPITETIGTAEGLSVQLRINRNLQFVDITTGAGMAANVNTNSSAIQNSTGYYLQCTFTASYWPFPGPATFWNKQVILTINTLKAL